MLRELNQSFRIGQDDRCKEYAQTFDIEREENSKEQPCSISVNECMQAISIVQGYFQGHGGSSKLFGALTEAENILVMKKASESTSQSRITNFLCPNIKNDQ